MSIPFRYRVGKRQKHHAFSHRAFGRNPREIAEYDVN